MQVLEWVVDEGTVRQVRVEDRVVVAVLDEHLQRLVRDRELRVGHEVVAVELHQVGLDEVARLARAGAADDDDVEVAVVLLVEAQARHRQPVVLGENEHVVRVRVLRRRELLELALVRGLRASVLLAQPLAPLERVLQQQPHAPRHDEGQQRPYDGVVGRADPQGVREQVVRGGEERLQEGVHRVEQVAVPGRQHHRAGMVAIERAGQRERERYQ